MGAQVLGSADPHTEWNEMGLENWLMEMEMVLTTVTSGDQPLLNLVCAYIVFSSTKLDWLHVSDNCLQAHVQ